MSCGPHVYRAGGGPIAGIFLCMEWIGSLWHSGKRLQVGRHTGGDAPLLAG